MSNFTNFLSQPYCTFLCDNITCNLACHIWPSWSSPKETRWQDQFHRPDLKMLLPITICSGCLFTIATDCKFLFLPFTCIHDVAPYLLPPHDLVHINTPANPLHCSESSLLVLLLILLSSIILQSTYLIPRLLQKYLPLTEESSLEASCDSSSCLTSVPRKCKCKKN